MQDNEKQSFSSQLDDSKQREQNRAAQVGNNQSFIVASRRDGGDIEKAHAINYSYMHLPSYDDELKAFRFTHEQFMYAIKGENMFALLQAINLRLVVELVEGTPYKLAQYEFTVQQVIVEPIDDSTEALETLRNFLPEEMIQEIKGIIEAFAEDGEE